jgi:transposase
LKPGHFSFFIDRMHLHVLPKAARRPDQLATQFITAITRLYAVEAKAKGKTVTERTQLREASSRSILTEIQHLLVTHRHSVTPGSLLGKALHYLEAQWPKLIRYVENGAWPIDNNLCENAIRPFVVGRRIGSSPIRWLVPVPVRTSIR